MRRAKRSLGLMLILAAAGCSDASDRAMHKLGQTARRLQAPPSPDPALEGCRKDPTALACEQLADAYREGNGRSRDHAVALGLYQRACAAHAGPSCVMEAVLLLEGKGVPHDRVRGMRLLREACSSGSGCDHLGAWLEKEGPEGVRQAVAIWKRACEGGRQPASCLTLADRLLAGRGMARDAGFAARMLEKACPPGERELLIGCDTLADLYLRGDGVARDPARAAEMLDRACHNAYFAFGCLPLARLYQRGVGVRRDARRARALLRRACDLGHEPEACAAL